MKKIMLSVVLLCLVVASSSAQDSDKGYYPWEVGVGFGLPTFGGEFNMNSEARWNHYNHWDSDYDYSYQVFAQRYLSHVFGVELGGSYNKISGEWDESYGNQDRVFDTRIWDVTLSGIVNFNNLFSKNKMDRKWNIYGKIGVGLGWLDIEEGIIPSDEADDTEFLIPLGIGVNVKLADRVKASVFADYKVMATDQLDGMFETGITGGDGRGKGVWGSYPTVIGLRLSYAFGGKSKAMEVSEPIPASEPTKVTPDPVQKVEEKPVPPPPPPVVEKPKETHTHDGETHAIDDHRHIHAEPGWPVNKSYVSGEIYPDKAKYPGTLKYRVQVLATYRRWTDLTKLGHVLKVSDDLFEYQPVKVYRYGTETTFSSYKEAKAYANKINSTTKVPDAYVVAFIGDKMIY